MLLTAPKGDGEEQGEDHFMLYISVKRTDGIYLISLMPDDSRPPDLRTGLLLSTGVTIKQAKTIALTTLSALMASVASAEIRA